MDCAAAKHLVVSHALKPSVFSLALIVSVSPFLMGSFPFYSTEARPAGMGDAFTAVADDASAGIFNPAGLTRLQNPVLSTQFSELISGLNRQGSVNAGSISFYAPLSGRFKGTAGASIFSYRASDLAQEQIFSASYARPILLEGFKGLSLGLSLKGMRRAYDDSPYFSNAANDGGAVTGLSDPAFRNGREKTVFGVDVGALARFGREGQYNVGASVSNLNRPQTGFVDASDKAESTRRLGAAYIGKRSLVSSELRQISRLSRVDHEMAFGFEYRLLTGAPFGFSLRSGYQQGSRDFESFNAGLSVLLNLFRLDYGYHFRTGLLSDTNGGHRFGLSYIFGEQAPARPIPSLQLSAIRFDEPKKPVVLEPLEKWNQESAWVTSATPHERAWMNLLLNVKYLSKGKGGQPIQARPEISVELNDLTGLNYGYAEAALRYWEKGNEEMALRFLSNLSGEAKQSRKFSLFYALCVYEQRKKTPPSLLSEWKKKEMASLNAYFKPKNPIYYMLRDFINQPKQLTQEIKNENRKRS